MPTESPVFQAFCGAGEPAFANRAELECAKVLDYYGIPWLYEPRTFVLEQDESGRVTEAFTPDFYLPEQDLYVELTVMKQSLVTRKNRKLRKLRATYPDVKIKLFYKRDLERLAQPFRLALASSTAIPASARCTSRQRSCARGSPSWARRSTATSQTASCRCLSGRSRRA